MFHSTTCQSPVGTLYLAATDDSLLGLWMAGQKYFGASVPGPLEVNDDLPFFQHARRWLDHYFAGARPDIADLPIAPIGSVFRHAVWKHLCEIPYGETTTYGEIAKAVARSSGLPSMSSQAVGGAVGHNPISIVIPCHRVIGRDGSLTGYAGGIEKKIQLLEHEGALSSLFYTPTRGTAL